MLARVGLQWKKKSQIFIETNKFIRWLWIHRIFDRLLAGAVWLTGWLLGWHCVHSLTLKLANHFHVWYGNDSVCVWRQQHATRFLLLFFDDLTDYVNMQNDQWKRDGFRKPRKYFFCVKALVSERAQSKCCQSSFVRSRTLIHSISPYIRNWFCCCCGAVVKCIEDCECANFAHQLTSLGV